LTSVSPQLCLSLPGVAPVKNKRNAASCNSDEQQFRLFDDPCRPIYCVVGATDIGVASIQPTPFNRFRRRVKIYIASKVAHAPKWRAYRTEGWPIVSTWIDEAGEGESSDLADLTLRCIEEAVSCTHLILYREHDEILKGALLECGAALANNVPVYYVGPSVSRIFEHHPSWHVCPTVDDALSIITGSQAAPVGRSFSLADNASAA